MEKQKEASKDIKWFIHERKELKKGVKEAKESLTRIKFFIEFVNKLIEECKDKETKGEETKEAVDKVIKKGEKCINEYTDILNKYESFINESKAYKKKLDLKINDMRIEALVSWFNKLKSRIKDFLKLG